MVNSYRRIEYKSYVIFWFYVDSTERRHAVLIPLSTQDENQSRVQKKLEVKVWATADKITKLKKVISMKISAA